MLRSADARHQVWVITNNYDHGSSTPLVQGSEGWINRGNARVLYLNRGIRSLSKGIAKSLSKRPEVVYLNGIFYPRLSISFQLLSRLKGGTLLVIAPRGELDPGALALKSSKKRLYLRLFKVARMDKRVIWHASTELEKTHIQNVMGKKSLVIVRENDTMLPALADRPAARNLGSLRLVFMSRLSRKKGLHVLLAALKGVKQTVTLDVIGPEEDLQYVSECHDLAAQCPENVEIRFRGPVASERMRETLAQYDLMAFPTAGENFGHVIAESLSVGCPVLCSDKTPWSDRLRAGAGQIVDSVVPADWAAAIDRYAETGAEGWFESRLAAAEGYEEWMRTNDAPHFFELIEKQLEDRNPA
ncbi:glycosyltransferase [Citricoccus sp. I39-566]|uniref:glycosyltransferase n=1 Tax=Citricoccus sp. I39-566 TaxID=3073268 RepID=UPI00286A8597|nr:glycosyltransferase [Citricoccus sp. I39-566]WMY78068.1 glycosyltransferase [Citricoccus sp. I39-566]